MFDDDDLDNEYLVELCYTTCELEGFTLALPELYFILGLFEEMSIATIQTKWY